MLSCFSKLFERAAYNQLLNYLEKNDILYQFQFGFRKRYGTELAVSFLTHKISEALETGKYALGVFLDLSKAFDTVNHVILLDKLSYYGIRGVPLDWFTSYLFNRSQYVSFQNEESDVMDIKCGVPQGSILGPLLFLLYINDLFLACPDCFILLFADDTNLFFSDINFDTLLQRTNATLRLITAWFNANKLSLNVDKTHFMVYNIRKKKYVPHNIHVSINNHDISQVSKIKFLGIWMDEQLNWKYHITYIANKISKVIGILKKVRQSVNSNVLLSLYYALVHPYYTYCNVTWASNYKSNLDSLVKLQKKILRIMSFSVFDAHTDPLFQRYGIMKFDIINNYLTCIFMFKIMNGMFPTIFRNIFVLNSNIHSYSTRQRHNLFTFACGSVFTSFSIRHHGTKMWNQLPLNLRQIMSFPLFKQKLRKLYLLS